MPIKAGYYRCAGGHNFIVAGSLVYAVQGKSIDKVDVLIDDDHYVYDLDEFEPVFEFAPDGAAEHKAKIDRLMREIESTEDGFGDLATQMLEFNPHMEGDELVGNGILVPQHSPHTPATIKRAVATVRNSIAKTKKALDTKRKELTALIEARSAALQLRVGEMNRLIEKANEAIWTINLYMGRDEKIHRLAEGEPAPKEEPITLRQRVLYMDEECAELTDDGQGIDISQLGIFDEWLFEDDNLARLLPEPKGIICLHARSREKHYADPWLSAQMNEANRHYTYFLIRNGENIYRIYADIVLSNVLFPAAREYEQLFRKTEFDWKTHSKKTEQIRPGNDDYMKAMEKCEEKQRHYLRVLLILQGLLDRTDIFKPLPVERINICNQADYFEFLRFTYDTGEAVLDNSKPSFATWLSSVNANIGVGHRVVGAFDSHKAGLHGHRDGNFHYGVRLYPENSNTPESDQVYTISRTEKHCYESTRYYFTYDRGEIWDRWDGYRQSQTRGSCYIHRDDKWVLDIDAAEVADIKYYLISRKGKKEYEDMVPIMERALKMKIQEAEEEAPFRQLLASQISQTHGMVLRAAVAVVDELVRWWKLKNRTHRALTSDDSKALKMIVAEFGLRQRRERERANLALRHDTVIKAVRQHAEPILIAHKSGNKYVAYVACNEESVWVREQIWTLNRTTGAIYVNEEREWRLVDKRHVRWEIVYKTERWDSWKINPRKATVLTDPEIESLLDEALETHRKDFEEEIADKGIFKSRRSWAFGSGRDRRRSQRFLPLVGAVDEKGNLKIWYSDQGPLLPNGRLFSRKPRSPVVKEATVSWTRKADGIRCRARSGSEVNNVPWVNSKKKSRFYEPTYRLLRYFDQNIKQIHTERQKAEELKVARQAICQSIEYVPVAVAKYLTDKQERAFYIEFVADFGDLELWGDHKAELEFKKIQGTYQVEIACCLLVERGINIVGMTLGEVIEQALPWGLLSNRKDFENNFDAIVENLPMEFIIPPPPPEDEEELGDI